MAKKKQTSPSKTKGNSGAREAHSNPILQQVLNLNSKQAQHVMNRSFDRVSWSLFSIGVILRIIGDPEEVDQVEQVIQDHLKGVSNELAKGAEQLKVLMKDNGLDPEEVVHYTKPQEYRKELSSPQLAQFSALVKKLDGLMGMLDTLWLNSVVSSKERSEACFRWQQILVRSSGRIVGIEKRARTSAYEKGKQQEVDAEAPQREQEDDNQETEADAGTPKSKQAAKQEPPRRQNGLQPWHKPA